LCCPDICHPSPLPTFYKNLRFLGEAGGGKNVHRTGGMALASSVVSVYTGGKRNRISKMRSFDFD